MIGKDPRTSLRNSCPTREMFCARNVAVTLLARPYDRNVRLPWAWPDKNQRGDPAAESWPVPGPTAPGRVYCRSGHYVVWGQGIDGDEGLIIYGKEPGLAAVICDGYGGGWNVAISADEAWCVVAGLGFIAHRLGPPWISHSLYLWPMPQDEKYVITVEGPDGQWWEAGRGPKEIDTVRVFKLRALNGHKFALSIYPNRKVSGRNTSVSELVIDADSKEMVTTPLGPLPNPGGGSAGGFGQDQPAESAGPIF